jgi:hypothetical protein
MKGQLRVEFIFGVIFFGMIILFIAVNINNVFTSTLTDSRVDSLKAKAIGLMTQLTSEAGDPIDWENRAYSDVKRIGLAFPNRPYYLSRNKIFKLNNTRIGDTCSLLESYNLGGYRIRIFDSTNEILFCGFAGVSQLTVILTRNVYIDDNLGNITVEVW